jgi:predicted metal-dependent RNase
VPPEIDFALLDAIVVTHAHIDHCGRLPLLRKRKWLQYPPPTSSSAPSTIQAAKLASEGPCTAQRIRVR